MEENVTVNLEEINTKECILKIQSLYYVILPVVSYGTSTSFRLQIETTAMDK